MSRVKRNRPGDFECALRRPASAPGDFARRTPPDSNIFECGARAPLGGRSADDAPPPLPRPPLPPDRFIFRRLLMLDISL